MKYLAPYSLMIIFFSLCFFGCTPKETKWKDDRMCQAPFMDSILEKMILDSKNRSDMNRNPEYDTTVYYITFNFFKINESERVWAMGSYQSPFIFHDSINFGANKFVGYFKRKNMYCFVYETLFDSLPRYCGQMKQSELSKRFIADWRLRNPRENPNFFRKDISDLIQDPYTFEYEIDSIGNVSLIRKGHW